MNFDQWLNRWLERIRLIDNISLHISLEKDEFIHGFKKRISSSNPGLLADVLYVLTSSDKVLKGYVSYLPPFNTAIAYGNFFPNENGILIKARIKAYGYFETYFVIFIVCSILLASIVVLLAGEYLIAFCVLSVMGLFLAMMLISARNSAALLKRTIIAEIRNLVTPM